VISSLTRTTTQSRKSSCGPSSSIARSGKIRRARRTSRWFSRRSRRFGHALDPRTNGSARSASVSVYGTGKVVDSAAIGRNVPTGHRSRDPPHVVRSLFLVPA
jgi:hypothetical protein